MVRSALVVTALTLLGCVSFGCRKSARNERTPEQAVARLIRAAEDGDSARTAAQFPPMSVLKRFLSCADSQHARMTSVAEEMSKHHDKIVARLDLVGVELANQRQVAVGPFEGECKALSRFQLAEARSRWKQDDADHPGTDGPELVLKIPLIELGGVWYPFDIPGM